MGVAAILTEVKTKLDELQSGVAWAVGAEHRAAHAEPPRVVWVPTSDSFGPSAHGGTNPKQLMTRRAGLTAYVWGATLADTETLLNNLIVAMHRAMSRNYTLGSAAWFGQDGDLVKRGMALTLPITVDIPIYPPAATTAVATEATQTLEFQTPGA